jgi:type II secretory pathway pseudopilin PulG
VNNYKLKSVKAQAGMTLIELTVVLLILVALAGLMVPYVGSFVQKTHDSTNSNNLAQLNNAMGRFIAEKNRMPAHMSALLNASGAGAAASGSCLTATANTIYCGMLDTTMFAPVTYSGTAATENIPLNSLKKAGFDMYLKNNQDTANKTFDSDTGMSYLPDPYAGTAAIFAQVQGYTKADGTVVSIPMHLSVALGGAGMDYNTTCYDYIAFGLGDKNEMVGNTMSASPVHFPENAELGPVQRYNHYVAIFQVDKSNTGTYSEAGDTKYCTPVTEKAKYLGAAMNVPAYPGSHLFGVGEALGYAYENSVNKDR